MHSKTFTLYSNFLFLYYKLITTNQQFVGLNNFYSFGFRLVIDRETGKPKGYGFCEYKDEETALSARRNLQGYAINGRQLRVDFAENDKGADRNREQVIFKCLVAQQILLSFSFFSLNNFYLRSQVVGIIVPLFASTAIFLYL